MTHVAARDKEAAEGEARRDRFEVDEAAAQEREFGAASSSFCPHRPADTCIDEGMTPSLSDESCGNSLPDGSNADESIVMPTMPCENLHRPIIAEHDLRSLLVLPDPLIKGMCASVLLRSWLSRNNGTSSWLWGVGMNLVSGNGPMSRLKPEQGR